MAVRRAQQSLSSNVPSKSLEVGAEMSSSLNHLERLSSQFLACVVLGSVVAVY